ncbi:hypothetical protein [Psychrobacillus sp. L4]|uniref:hypothetical protein n=1 Tax=Psychrobacillus sp. L4 TaxID=3236892 RepID=UPI0036F2A5E3
MPSISKIRFTNIIYEDGQKRYNDETFLFDGHNGAIVLENGGGKTVFIQTAIQAVLPNTELANRKIKDTLKLEEAPAHIAIEWILNERPRRYALTCVSLFLTKHGIDSYKYVYEYAENDKHSIEEIPFVRTFNGKNRPADRGEIQEYYSGMVQNHLHAKTFDSKKSYTTYLEETFHIIPSEWDSIVKINSSEGGVEAFFDECKTTGQLFDRLLIPTVEDSMTGFQKDGFAEIFENHLSSFKRYKQLKEKIEEYEHIKRRVEVYVKSFEKLDDQVQAYTAMREQTKSLWQLSKQREHETKLKLEQVNEKLQQLESRHHLLVQKEQSYKISVEEENLRAIQEILEKVVEQQVSHEKKIATENNLYQSLKLADYHKEVQTEKDRKTMRKQKLFELDQSIDTTEILDALYMLEQEIHGYFNELEEKLTKEIQEITYEQQAQLTLVEKEQAEQREKLGIQQQLIQQETKKQTIIDHNNKAMQAMELELLADPKNETIEQQQKFWMNKRQQLDEQNVQLIERNKQIKQQQQTISASLQLVQENMQQAQIDTSALQTTQEKIDSEQIKLKLLLAERSHQWLNVTSVYLRQDSIEKKLAEELGKLSSYHEKLLYDERLASRFSDDYSYQNSFFADTFLDKQLEQWKNQFDFLETGVSYIQSLPKSSTLVEKYPFWAMTFITTTKNRDALQEKIVHYQHKLQFPVNILTLDEASAIVRDDVHTSDHWISPKHWEHNLDNKDFQSWKESMVLLAETAKQKRQDNEKQLQSWQQLQLVVQQYFTQYPYHYTKEITEKLAFSQERVYQLRSQEKQYREQLEKLTQELTNNAQQQEQNKDHIHGLEQAIQKSLKYIALKKECTELEQEKSFVQTKKEKISKEIEQHQRMIHSVQSQLDQLKSETQILSTQIQFQIHENRLYQTVRSVEPIYTNKNLEILEQARTERKMELEGITKGRNDIETHIQQADTNISRLKQEIKHLELEYPDLGEPIEFPPNGSVKMQQLQTSIREHKRLLVPIIVEAQLKQAEVYKRNGIIQNMKSNIQEILTFEGQLSLIKEEISIEKKAWKEENKHTNESKEKLEKDSKNSNEIIIEFEKYDMKHGFLENTVHVASLSPDESSNYLYNQSKLVKENLRQLDEQLEKVQKEQKRVEKEKSSYIEFCRSDISDTRMRETAIQGIENKLTFSEVQKYKELLEGRITTALKYAEQKIRTHDEELEQFIVHIHTHLIKISDELKLIPKKTSVKVENNWKQIFTFHIPEWKEEEGKSSVREHLNWFLHQLDREAYTDDQGQTSTTKVRNDLNKWLHSKQLLQVVMKNQTMKVLCHKVTNDNKITKASYSWEQSNVWSGGEKWSKNMTLFLGLLNYVAEKRQHIQASSKLYRAVIMDNPFGKASSDHVLSPVFFIAEQLGFQIIALTAHAEGKFLRDFFPVIYSCRLRNAAGSDKQIMTKEKTIQNAYFQDHAPHSLQRLGEIEQMELF